jgi:hypothetical protein
MQFFIRAAFGIVATVCFVTTTVFTLRQAQRINQITRGCTILVNSMNQTINHADDVIKTTNTAISDILPHVIGLLEISSNTISSTDEIVGKVGHEASILINTGTKCLEGFDATNRNVNGILEFAELMPIRRRLKKSFKSCFGYTCSCFGSSSSSEKTIQTHTNANAHARANARANANANATNQV